MKNKNIVVFGGIIVIAIISLSVFVRPKTSKAPTNDTKREAIPYNKLKYITPKELREKIVNNESLILLDIRDQKSFLKEHIENSINVSKSNLDKIVSKLPRNNVIVLVSYNYEGKETIEKIVKDLKAFGFKGIIVLSGGIDSWKRNNNPLISGGNPNSVLDISKVSYILPEQLKLAIDNNYPIFIIDVRPNFLFKEEHIPKAINIPFNELEREKDKIPFTSEIVVYGNNEVEDFRAGVKLYDMGFVANYLIKGGFSEWKNKKYNTIK